MPIHLPLALACPTHAAPATAQHVNASGAVVLVRWACGCRSKGGAGVEGKTACRVAR